MNELIKKILEQCKKINKTKLISTILVYELAILNLRVEKIFIDKKNKYGSPTKIAKKYLKNLLNLIEDLKTFDEYGKKIIIKKIKFKREIEHKKLFEKLWTNYSFEQYKKERLTRYLKRIKINKLQSLIKRKKIIDFGCGHGNFLIACYLTGAEHCVGIDYGKGSINYGNNILKKLSIKKNKIKLLVKSVYKSNQRNNFFDFGILNGVFHHLENESIALKEIHRVLKPNGYLWIYVRGGGGLSDSILDMSQNILRTIDKNFVVNQINSLGLTTNKEYHLNDGLNALYRRRTLPELKKQFKRIGFYNFKQLKGGYKTDYDKPFYKDKYFKEKFGSGDLRILCKKK